MSNDSFNIFGIHIFFDKCISQHRFKIHNKNGEHLQSLRSFFCSFNSLLLFKIFFHHTFNWFLYYSVFIENRMTLIASFHFDWSFYCRIYCESSTTDAVYLYVFEILRVNSFFHTLPLRNIKLSE